MYPLQNDHPRLKTKDGQGSIILNIKKNLLIAIHF